MTEQPIDETTHLQKTVNGAASNGSGTHGGGLETNPLSEREMDVAELLVTGATNNEIAQGLVISPHTVKVHLRNIYEKLQVNSRTEASTLLLQQGWIVLPGLDVSAQPDGAAAPPSVAAPIEPQPLAHTMGRHFGWQPIYLALSIVLVLAVWISPSLLGQPVSAPDLLSDSSALSLGQPVVQIFPRWEARTPLPAARSRLALVPLEGRALYAIGGERDAAGLLRNVDRYDLAVNEWRSVDPLPIPLSNLAATEWRGQIIVAGGTTIDRASSTRVVSDGLWIYRPQDDAWHMLGKLPVPLAGASLVAVGDDLYLLGGWDGDSARGEVWRVAIQPDVLEADYIEAEAWRPVTELAVPHAFGGAAVVENEIYVAGGFDGQQELDTAQVYSIAEESWRRLPPMNTPRGGMALLYDGLALFAVGGGWKQPVATLERFDPETNLWSHFPAPIDGEWRHLGAAASTRGYLYLVGGWSGAYLNTHLQYQSSFRTFIPQTRNSGP